MRDKVKVAGCLHDNRGTLLAGIEPEIGESADGEAEEEIRETPVEPVTRPGDIWWLGRHRSICGDCRDYGTVARLLDGLPANVAITLPPYATQREYDPTSGFKPIPSEEYVEWYRGLRHFSLRRLHAAPPCGACSSRRC